MRKPLVLASLIVALSVLVGTVATAITVTRVTVATTATLIYTAGLGGSTAMVRNAGAASVYVGTSAVLTTTGFELAAGDAITVPLGPSDTLYGIVASGTVVVHVMESRK